jgi:hypothetical protein
MLNGYAHWESPGIPAIGDDALLEFCRGVSPWAPLTAREKGGPRRGCPYNFVKLDWTRRDSLFDPNSDQTESTPRPQVIYPSQYWYGIIN